MKAWANTLPSGDDLRQMKRDAVIRQAALSFRDRGFHGTSMSDLAISLGLTKAALYRYVRTKHEVLFECFKASERLADAFLIEAKNHNGPVVERLRVFVQCFVEEYLLTNTAGPMMVDIKSLLPKQRKEIIQGRDRIDRGLRELIQEGIQDGSIAEVDPKLSSLIILGAINWIPVWFSPTGSLTAAQVADGVVKLFLTGLMPRAESIHITGGKSREAHDTPPKPKRIDRN